MEEESNKNEQSTGQTTVNEPATTINSPPKPVIPTLDISKILRERESNHNIIKKQANKNPKIINFSKKSSSPLSLDLSKIKTQKQKSPVVRRNTTPTRKKSSPVLKTEEKKMNSTPPKGRILQPKKKAAIPNGSVLPKNRSTTPSKSSKTPQKVPPKTSSKTPSPTKPASPVLTKSSSPSPTKPLSPVSLTSPSKGAFMTTAERFPKSPKLSSNLPVQYDIPRLFDEKVDPFMKQPTPSFRSTSPRFPQNRNLDTPPPGKYTPIEPGRKHDYASTAFRSSAKRFEEPKSDTPPPTKYNPDYNYLENRKIRPTSPFRTTSKRYSYIQKSQSPPPTRYNPSKSIFDTEKQPASMAPFRSSSPRFERPKERAPSPAHYDIRYSSFNTQSPSFSLKGSFGFADRGLLKYQRKTPNKTPEFKKQVHDVLNYIEDKTPKRSSKVKKIKTIIGGQARKNEEKSTTEGIHESVLEKKELQVDPVEMIEPTDIEENEEEKVKINIENESNEPKKELVKTIESKENEPKITDIISNEPKPDIIHVSKESDSQPEIMKPEIISVSKENDSQKPEKSIVSNEEIELKPQQKERLEDSQIKPINEEFKFSPQKGTPKIVQNTPTKTPEIKTTPKTLHEFRARRGSEPKVLRGGRKSITNE